MACGQLATESPAWLQDAEGDAQRAASLAAQLAPVLFDEGSNVGSFLRSQRPAYLKALHLLQVCTACVQRHIVYTCTTASAQKVHVPHYTGAQGCTIGLGLTPKRQLLQP